MYENYCKLGPYTRKDNRKIISIKIGDSWRTISYPKYLMEEYLGRFLNDDETVDHINADFTDDRIENLQILTRAQNAAKAHKDFSFDYKSRPYPKGENTVNSKFTHEEVKELRSAYAKGDITMAEIQKIFNVTKMPVIRMLYGKSYCDVEGALVKGELPPRKRKLSEIKIQNIKELYSKGLSILAIHKELGVDRATIRKYLNKQEI